MEDRSIEIMSAFMPALLRAMDALDLFARYLNAQDASALIEFAVKNDGALRDASPRLAELREDLAPLRGVLEDVSTRVLAAFDDLRAAETQPNPMIAIFRALRHGPRAQEALYQLAGFLAPVSRYFLPAHRRDDDALENMLSSVEPRDNVGVMHFDNEWGGRGGCSVYVPEYYTPDRDWPLVVALHGGSGLGRGFLWSWLRDARARGAIVIAPTAIGETWALMDDDVDTPNLVRMVEAVAGNWSVDRSRLLLTGLSDGGTFSYVSGLEPGSIFTHLAPVAAAFHPMLAAMADRERLRDLPMYIVHGVHDWMFPVGLAQQAHKMFSAAGARVVYREIADLSHTYPREENARILDWLCT